MQGQESPLNTHSEAVWFSLLQKLFRLSGARWEPKERLGTPAIRLFHKMALAASKRSLDSHAVSKASMGASWDSTLRPWL